jgi:poly(3-hydroxybutyrate) depolymerase
MRGLALVLMLGVAATVARGQQEYVVTIPTTLADTTETFWLQIPAGYQPELPCPLLIGWHQLGGNHLEFKHATDFDSIANARGWIAASHDGPTPTHWNNHAAQSHVVDVIRWIEARYAVDAGRIYMVGASMGGAAGMVFSNNRLDPGGPRVAAAASLSGIQDCERRFHEQGWNNSMVGAFGGTPEQVPYEYHRNSAICFADSAASMHCNARHLPLYLTFGHGTSDDVWRRHAEDLYAVMHGWADTVVLRESARAGHGWTCAEEGPTCDFLGAFRLEGAPRTLSINADEEGRWSWAELGFREPDSSFGRIEVAADPAAPGLQCAMVRNVAAARLDLTAIDFPFATSPILCRWAVRDPGAAELGLLGVPTCPARVDRDGLPYASWSYDPEMRLLTLSGEGDGLYAIHLDPAAAVEGRSVGTLRVAWIGDARVLDCRLPAAGPARIGLWDASGRCLGSGACVAGEDRAARLAIRTPLASGIYFVTADGGAGRAVCRLPVLR